MTETHAGLCFCIWDAMVLVQPLRELFVVLLDHGLDILFFGVQRTHTRLSIAQEVEHLGDASGLVSGHLALEHVGNTAAQIDAVHLLQLGADHIAVVVLDGPDAVVVQIEGAHDVALCHSLESLSPLFIAPA